MFTVTLKQLNLSYQSLLAVGQIVNKGKISYRLGRTIASAKTEIDLLQRHLATIAADHGAEMNGGGSFSFQPEQKEEIKAFNKEADDFLKAQTVELWGEASYFKITEFEQFDIAANDFANLLWLIGEDDETEKPKAQAATA